VVGGRSGVVSKLWVIPDSGEHSFGLDLTFLTQLTKKIFRFFSQVGLHVARIAQMKVIASEQLSPTISDGLAGEMFGFSSLQELFCSFIFVRCRFMALQAKERSEALIC